MAAQPAAGGNLAILSQHPSVTAEDWAKNPAAATMKALEGPEEGSLQGRLESEPVSSTDRDRGTRVRG